MPCASVLILCFFTRPRPVIVFVLSQHFGLIGGATLRWSLPGLLQKLSVEARVNQ